MHVRTFSGEEAACENAQGRSTLAGDTGFCGKSTREMR